MSLMTCRFCGKSEYDDQKMVHYSTRHYAHHRCYLERKKPLSDLHDWQIVRFPYRLLQEFGLIREADAAFARIKKAEKAAS
jgi:hypothetical protein